MRKKALLAVSFGTSHPRTLDRTIGAIEGALARDFAEHDLFRAFTSPTVIRKIKEAFGEDVPNVPQALRLLEEKGYSEVILQPTHILNGFEYEKILRQAKPFETVFERLAYGAPLLSSQEDMDAAAALLNGLAAECAEDTALVFMGHGTEHAVNPVYKKLDSLLRENSFLGTVESEPTLEQVLSKVKAAPGFRRVILQPFMIVAGDHACNDMASDEPDSWKSCFEAEGYETSCRLKGLGEYESVRSLFIRHARNAIEKGMN